MADSIGKINRYKDIVFYRTVAGIKSEARQNYLGYLWFMLEPLLSTAVFYLALTKITGSRGPEYIAFLLLGTLSWQWFESSVSMAASSIREKYSTLIQFDLPKFIFPAVSVLINTWKFFVTYAVLLALMPLLGYTPGWRYLELVPVLLIQLLLILGLSFPLALVITLSNDLKVIMGSTFRLMFFLSGIIFQASSVPESLQPAFYSNPMAVLVESCREIVLHDRTPNLPRLAYATGVAVVLLAGGMVLHQFLDKRILKMIHV
jgi:lipopolysaccharide transport system permease protein